jgi:hypothetical protein
VSQFLQFLTPVGCVLVRTSKKLSNFHGIALPLPNKGYAIACTPVPRIVQLIIGF